MKSFALGLAPLVLFALPAAAADAPEATRLGKLTVTGSHLARDLQDANPVTSVDRDALLAAGHETLGEFLQSLPMMAGAPISTAVGARGSGGGFARGIETIELRGLGPERTLVLMNGRRIVGGGNGTSGIVDLAMIPMAVVERIDILKTGASVEYGADAVAGVVNIITRNDTPTLQLAANSSITDRGDAETATLSAVAGRELKAGRLLAGIEYFDQNAVSKGDRAFSRQWLTVDGEDNTVVPDGSSAPPNGNFRTSNGRLTLIDGAPGTSPDDFRPFVSRGPDTDRYNLNPFEDLLQDSRRVSAFALGRHALTPTIDVFAEALYQQRDSDTGLAPLPFFTNRLDGVAVAADNIYNPFGEEISDARRRLVEGGTRRFVQDNSAWRLVAGVDGLLGAWTWDASVNHGHNEVTQRQTGDLLRDRVALALGPSFIDGDGRATCGTPDAPIAGCVPLNLFGGPGSITPAMLEYAGLSALTDRFENDQTTVSANINGDLFELPTGPLAAAFGYEYRDERAKDIPDPQTQAGNTTGAARAATRGDYQSHELYAEFGLPLLRDAPGAKSLDLELGARTVDYSNFSARTVFDSGVIYQPVDRLVLRAAYAQAFRAPTVAELFGGVTQSNPAVDDPCADFSQLTETQVERCVAQGVPADGSFDQTGNETPQLGGGNPDLEPEDAQIITAGLSWRPPAIAGLQLSLDFYDITIDDGIAGLGANTLLDQCLATGEASFCERIERDGTGAITQVRSELQNIARETARGLDFETRYSHAAGTGELSHRLLLSHVLERELKAFPDAEPFVGEGEYDPDNFGAIPRWKGRYSLGWQRGALRLGYAAQWVGSLDERGGELFPDTTNAIPSRLYHDLSAGWTWASGARVTLGIDNLTDLNPPFFANADLANTDVSTYRLLGRTLRLQFAYSL